MSRNNNRTGFPEDTTITQDESPAPVVTTTPGVGPSSGTGNAPAFNWSVPTEFVTIPSGGRFYPETHPLHNQRTVEIRYMTAKEEDILTSRSLLREGVAVNRMLQNIVVDERINVDDLLIGDKNALMVAARRTGYGADYTTRITCPSCGNTEDFTFDITDPKFNNYENTAQESNVSFTEVGTINITLPMTQATVECALLTGADETRLFKEAKRKNKRSNQESSLTDAIRSYIVGVNGDASPLTIEAFIQALPARDARVLRSTYMKAVPNLDMTEEYSCTNCGYIADMEVPLTTDFFWPK